jgi:hypothetical protein
LMTYPHLKPQKPSQQYVPRVFGFKLHKQSWQTFTNQVFYLVLGMEHHGPKTLWPVDSCVLGSSDLPVNCWAIVCAFWYYCCVILGFFHLIKICPFACFGDVLGACHALACDCFASFVSYSGKTIVVT